MSAWPDDSVQSFCSAWWTKKLPQKIERGRLIWAYLPHMAQQPMLLVPESRPSPTEHGSFLFRIEAFDIGRPSAPPRLPVAAMPDNHREERFVLRAKKRPAVIICQGGGNVPGSLRTGGAKRFHPTCLVVPSYGGDQSGKRAGYKPEFIQRIRRAEWPQFIWDSLPLHTTTRESILRLDHIQPISRDNLSIQLTEFCLSDEALVLLDEWLVWLQTGMLPADGHLLEIRETLLETDASI